MSNKKTEKNYLDDALEKFIEAMRSFISSELDDWERKYFQTLTSKQQESWGMGLQEGKAPLELIDFGNLKSFALKQKEFCAAFFGRDHHSLPTMLDQIKIARNMIAHYNPFNKEKAEIAYLQMLLIAKKLNMYELEEDIRKLKDGMPIMIKPDYKYKLNKMGARYESARLTFKKDVIEPLSMDDEFTVYVSNDGGSYTMSKRDFYRVFHNVVKSDSYSVLGNYNYKQTPQKAQEFFKAH